MSNPYSYKGQTTMRTEYAIVSHELKSGQKIVSQSTVAPDEIGILTRGQTMTPEELLAADIVIKAKCAKMNAVFLRMNGAAGRLLNVRQIQVFFIVAAKEGQTQSTIGTEMAVDKRKPVAESRVAKFVQECWGTYISLGGRNGAVNLTEKGQNLRDELYKMIIS